MASDDSNVCINCGSPISSNYCPECGQKKSVKKLKVKVFIDDFLNKVYGLDGTLPRTVIDLTLRPGRVIHEYIKGNRVRYVSPIGYYFLMFAILFVLSSVFGVELMPDSENIAKEFGDQTERQREFAKETTAQLSNYLQFLTLLVFPFISFWCMIFFRKGYTLMEHMVFVIYSNSHPIILNIVIGPLTNINFAFFFTLNLIISVAYFAWCALQFYYKKFSLWGIIKAVLAYLLGFIAFILLFSILLFLFKTPL